MPEIEIELDAEEKVKQITSIYQGDLDFNSIKDNPILKPIAEINETYINLELMINKALIEYEEIQNEINGMVEANPVYSETMLMAKIQTLKILVKQMIHSQDLQKANMRNKINEMIRIAEEEYDVRVEEEMILEEKPIKKVGRPRIEEPKEEIIDDDIMKKLKKITEEEKPSEEKEKKLKKMTGEEEKPSEEKEEKKEKPKEVYSNLVERKIPREDIK